MVKIEGYKPDCNNTITISVSGSNTSQTVVLGQRYRVISTVDCYMNNGAAATTSKMYLPALAPEIFVANDTTWQFITAGASGTVFLTVML